MFNKNLFYFLVTITTINLNSFSINKSNNYWINIEEKSIKSVVKIINYCNKFNWLKPFKSSDDEVFYGTGFFIDNQGHILTNYHVIEDASEVKINIPAISNKELKVDIISIYPELDIALLKLTSSSKQFLTKKIKRIEYLKLGNSDQIKSGEPIITLGFPLNTTKLIATSGIIGTPKIGTDIQFSAPISRGNSGGPLINIKGEVIGINVAVNEEGQNTNFAIQINIVKKNLNNLKKYKVLNMPNLGCKFIKINKEFIEYFEYSAEMGTYIYNVQKESIADKINLKSRYLITEINKNKVDSIGNVWLKNLNHSINFYDYLKTLEIGQTINLITNKRQKQKIFNFKFEEITNKKINYIYTEVQKDKLDFEIFGGLILMNLTLNHIDLLSELNNNLFDYYLPGNQQEPAVIITHVFQNSPASKRYMQEGMIIDIINDVKIKTLEDLKKVFENIDIDSNLRIWTKDPYFFILPVKKILKYEDNLSLKYKYNKSELLKN